MYRANEKLDVAPRRHRRCRRSRLRDRGKAGNLASRQLLLLPGLMKIRLHPQTLHLAVLRKRVNVTKRDSAANELGMKRISLSKCGRIRQ